MKTRVGRYLIYGLVDPRSACLFYVGKTHKRREIRLAEHIKQSHEGSVRLVHRRISAIVDSGSMPQIFVLEKTSPEDRWQTAEKRWIEFWRNTQRADLPYIRPPQTAKSKLVVILHVDLLNIRDGG